MAAKSLTANENEARSVAPAVDLGDSHCFMIIFYKEDATQKSSHVHETSNEENV